MFMALFKKGSKSGLPFLPEYAAQMDNLPYPVIR